MDLTGFLGKEMKCACGHVHRTDVKVIDIGRGALKRLPWTLRKIGARKVYLVADLKTWDAVGKTACEVLSAADFEFEKYILREEAPVPDEKTVGTLLVHFPQDADLVLAAGSGTVNDLCKYISFARHTECAVLASAPSMDGFVSMGAALIVNHMKTTFDTHAPAAVIADADILAQAPMEMITAGLGDILGKTTCLLDWKLSHIINDEYYCEETAQMVRSSLRIVLSQASNLKKRDPDAVCALTEALVLTGLAMSFAGSSRPASGCEHHMSHYWEILFLYRGKNPILHGTSVGVATIAALRMYHMLAETLAGVAADSSESSISSSADNPEAADSASSEKAHSASGVLPENTDADADTDSAPNTCGGTKTASAAFSFENAASIPFNPSAWEEKIRKCFGKAADEILALEKNVRKNDIPARNRRLEIIRSRLPEIQYVLKNDLPPVEEMEALMLSIGAPIHPEQVGVSLKEVRNAVLYAREVRARYTLLQLLWDLGLSERFADRLCEYYIPEESGAAAGPAAGCLQPAILRQQIYFDWKKEQLRERISKIKCFVLDMDGTIYLSKRLFPFTKPFLDRLEATGRHFCYFTNNSSSNRQNYIDKLSGMGIPASPERIFLSTEVILEEMQQLHPDDIFYIVGTPNLSEAFRRAGLTVYEDLENNYPKVPGGYSLTDEILRQDGDSSAGPGLPVVILGFDTTLTYEKISRACRFLRRGAPYYGVNMDYNCPVDNHGYIDYIPDCGSMAKLVERSTGRFPDFYGKPSRHALDYIIRHTGFAENEIAVVGDRIYTDIAIANGTQALSIMVLTGETQMDDLEHYDFRPDVILPSLAEITELL